MNAWEKNIRKVVPYVPGDQPNQASMIKLNTNENPYPPAPSVCAYVSALRADDLRRYPDPNCSHLVDSLAGYFGLDSSEVFVGVGSDDVLAMIFLTFFNSDKPIIFPDVTYSFYQVWADLFKIPYKAPALDPDFKIKKEDYYGVNGGVIFPNPNAPTGVLLPLEDIEDIIKRNQEVIVVVDEAYIDFGGESALDLIHKYENLIIVQTFSKSRSLAGLRIGYAMADHNLIKSLNDVKYSYNSYTMNTLALELGAVSLKEENYFRETLAKVISTRENAKKRLTELGFTCTDSMTNFIFASHKICPAKELFEVLKSERIYVRYFHLPRLYNYLRISVGTDKEMDQLFIFLENYLSKK